MIRKDTESRNNGEDGGLRMPTAITSETLSKEALKAIFDAAFMDNVYDDEGDLRVKDRVNCWVLPSERRDRIQLMAVFRFKSTATRLQRLEFVNAVNKQYILIKAVAGNNDSLLFYFDILVGDGISGKTLMTCFKRFCDIPHDAVADLGKDIVE
jgi:hypothetical protein